MILRVKLIFIFFSILFCVVLVRLFYWQIIKASELREDAKKQYQLGRSIQAPRGSILASDGSFLVGRGIGWLVYAQVKEMSESKEKIADMLSPFFIETEEDLGTDDTRELLLGEADRLKSLLGRPDAVWVPLKHKIDNTTKENIEALDIEGLGFDPEDLRVYPEASLAAQLVGFVGKNDEGLDQGYFGIEGYWDDVLSGKPGVNKRDMDARGLPIILGSEYRVGASSGVDLITHINKGIQYIVENKLKEGLEKYGASSGSVVVMDPATGGIIAMSSFPSYDPLKYFDFSDELFKNPVVSDSFEPGSVFKVIVMASALDDGLVKPDTVCDICSGPARVDKYSIETWNNKYYPDSTMTDVIVHSDNVGMVFIANKLGIGKMVNYLEKFGFGQTTGIDVQGEFAPSLRDEKDWNIVDLAVSSFGQGIAITPIQLVKAVSAIANDGIMVTPQVVDRVRGEGWEEDIKPQIKENVISKEAADNITAMMVEAANYGEAKWTHLKGFKVAGKTGTAQIPISGHYDDEKTIASFIGFAPADKPKFLMLVTLREPQSSPWASETAAPLWYNIAKDLFLHYGIQPEE